MLREHGRLILSFFQKDVSTLRGVGSQTHARLNHLNIYTVRDLLWHRPLNWTAYPLLPLSGIRSDVKLTAHIRILRLSSSRKMLCVTARDINTESYLELIFFKGHFKSLEHLFRPSTQWFVSGETSLFEGRLAMIHPARWHAHEKGIPPLYEITYPLTKGLSSKTLQTLMHTVLTQMPHVEEWLPLDLVTRSEWPSFTQALKNLHGPSPETALQKAYERLGFDELLAYQFVLLGKRLTRSQEACIPLNPSHQIASHLLKKFGFRLTTSQQATYEEILQDLQKSNPMSRLLQGDVGSGKTILAYLALAHTVESGYQGAFLAPTEILAHQQAEKLQNLLEEYSMPPSHLQVSLLTGTTKRKKKVLEDIADGTTHIAVGTHALFQEKVAFKNLNLVVIDEQHRFGVEQRFNLLQKGTSPHFLAMSATPIPRTLEMTFFGDLDVSTLSEKPQGRSPIETRIVSPNRLNELESFVEQAMHSGAHIYWVCPLITPEDLDSPSSMPLPAVIKRFEELCVRFPGKVGMVHGLQKTAEKQATLDAFREGQCRLLVSTTVIEVGVDVPQATIMVIEAAQQFGLAQLHQLRGRVGRGQEKSFCFLVYTYPISELGRERLNILKKSSDGFWIAEQDWRLRGGGDILGTQQSGLPHFFFADLNVHFSLLSQAKQQAELFLKHDPLLQKDEDVSLRLLLKIFKRSSKLCTA